MCHAISNCRWAVANQVARRWREEAIRVIKARLRRDHEAKGRPIRDVDDWLGAQGEQHAKWDTWQWRGEDGVAVGNRGWIHTRTRWGQSPVTVGQAEQGD